MEYKDYYATLGVKRTASAAEIKKAFRALARRHHPDVTKGDPGSEARFKDVNEAYEVLSDPEKRARYDALGANWEQVSRNGGPFGGFSGGPFGMGGFGSAGGGSGPGGVRYEFRSGDGGGFSDFFRMFFSGGGPTASPGGSTSENAPLEDLFAGIGAMPESGRGGRRRGAAAGHGTLQPVEAAVEITLEEAFTGTTRLVEVDGKRLEVTVPAGVDDGSRIRLRGKGGGSGPDVRDLHLVTRVRPHAVFTRKGADLTRELAIGLREALLGGEVRVPTLGRTVLLKIPAGTQPGRTFRLAGQGMPRLRGEGRGDLLVRVRVDLPVLADETERRAAEVFLDALEHHGAPR